MPQKEKPKRKLPKKSKRPKRRYILFSLNCKTAKQAFDLAMGQFSQVEKKEFGIWFIQFNPKTGQGILRCRHSALQEARKKINSLPSEFEPKTLLSSGTIKTLKEKME